MRQLRAAGLVNNIYFVVWWDYVEANFPDFRTEPKSPTYFAPSHWAGHDALMTQTGSMTLSRVAAYHQAGLEVLHSRANAENVWANAIRLSFDGIMTDRPNELRDFCRTVR